MKLKNCLNCKSETLHRVQLISFSDIIGIPRDSQLAFVSVSCTICGTNHNTHYPIKDFPEYPKAP